MSLAKHIVDRLIALGATAEVKGLEVVVTVDDVTTRLRIEDEADD
jgi:hypothetical protein